MSEQIGLNEHHRRRLLVSCEYVDQLLADIESVMAAGMSLSPFPKYIEDLTAAEKEQTREAIGALRTKLVALLQTRNVIPSPPAISSRHSILTCLGYIDIAVEELKPRYLGGYGAVPPVLVPEMDKAVEEVQTRVKQAIAALKEAIQGEGDISQV